MSRYVWPSGIGACSGAGISGASTVWPARASARVAGSLKKDRAAPVAALDMRDPDGAVDGRSADRVAALGDDLSGTPAQSLLAVDAEEMECRTADVIEHARMALGGADLAHDGGRCVRRPVDRAVVLLHERPQPPGHGRVVVVQRLGSVAVRELAERLDERLDGAPADFVAVEAALADRAGPEVARRPDVAGVGLLGGLEDRDAPLGHAVLDRP